MTRGRRCVERVKAGLKTWLRVFGPKRPRPVRTPTVLQMEAVECGAACLGIVLAHFGRWVALEELRLACGVSRDGSTASNMVKAARSYGLLARGLKLEPGGLESIEPPAILHWNFEHFVVLDGIGRHGVRLNDPDTGPRSVSWKEIDQSFTGVVLTMRPGPRFEVAGSAPSLVSSLARRLSGTYLGVLFGVLASLFLVIPGLAAPAFSEALVDEVLLKGHRRWLAPLLLGLGATAFLHMFLVWLQQTYLVRLETKLAVTGAARFLWHVLRLPLEFFGQRYAGEVSSRVAINDRVAQLLARDVATNCLSALMILFFGAVMFRYAPALTLVSVLFVFLNVAALRYVSRKRTDGNRRLLKDRGKLEGTAIGGIEMIETLKASGGEEGQFIRWAGYQAKVVNSRQELERYTQVLDTVPPLLIALNSALILGLGSLSVIEGSLTLGALVAFQLLVASFMSPVQRLVNLGSQLQLAEGDMHRLDDVLRYPAADMGEDTLDELPPDRPVKLNGSMEMRKVCFGYSPLGPPLIRDFDLVMESGSQVALVGDSGSGKSTLGRLIVGLYTPSSGEILFEGVPNAA